MSQTFFDALNGVSLQNFLDLQNITNEVADSSLLTSASGSTTSDDSDIFQCGRCKMTFTSISRFIIHKKDHGLLDQEKTTKGSDIESCNEFTELRIQTLDSDDMAQPVILTDSDMLSFTLEPGALSVSTSAQLTPGSFVISPVPSEDKYSEKSLDKDAYNTDLPSPSFSSANILKRCYKVLVPGGSVPGSSDDTSSCLNDSHHLSSDNTNISDTPLRIYEESSENILAAEYSAEECNVEFIDSGVELSSGEEAHNRLIDYSNVGLLGIVQPTTKTNDHLNMDTPKSQRNSTSKLVLKPPIPLLKKYRPIAPAPVLLQSKLSAPETLSIRDIEKQILAEAKANTLSKDEQQTDQTVSKLKLECEFCHKKFAKGFDLQQHVRSHTGEKPFQCVVCGRAFSQKSNCKKHMASHKVWPKGAGNTLPKEPLHLVVRNTTSSSNDLCEESRIDSTISSKSSPVEGVINKSYVCQFCPEVFTNYVALKTHMKEHAHQKVFWCIQKNCKKTFTDLDEFVEHTLSHKDAAKYRCHICNKTFGKLSELGLHQYEHISLNGSKPKKGTCYRCVKCRSKFATPESLEHHMNFTSHDHCCPYCGKSFSCERYLRRHIVVHDQEDAYTCPECGKGFKTMQYLNLHKLTHSNEKPFKCQKCSAAFNRKDKLMRHSVTHEATKKFKCPFRTHLACMKEFNRSDKLKLHILTHCTKPITCKKCNKSFKRINLLHRHMRCHSSQSYYMCVHCCLSFSTKAERESHQCLHLKKSAARLSESGDKHWPSSLSCRSARSKRRKKPKTPSELKMAELTEDSVKSIEIIVVPVNNEQQVSELGKVFPLSFQDNPSSIDASQSSSSFIDPNNILRITHNYVNDDSGAS